MLEKKSFFHFEPRVIRSSRFLSKILALHIEFLSLAWESPRKSCTLTPLMNKLVPATMGSKRPRNITSKITLECKLWHQSTLPFKIQAKRYRTEILHYWALQTRTHKTCVNKSCQLNVVSHALLCGELVRHFHTIGLYYCTINLTKPLDRRTLTKMSNMLTLTQIFWWNHSQPSLIALPWGTSGLLSPRQCN